MKRISVQDTEEIIEILKAGGYTELAKKVENSCSTLGARKRIDKWHEDNNVGAPPIGKTKTTVSTIEEGEKLAPKPRKAKGPSPRSEAIDKVLANPNNTTEEIKIRRGWTLSKCLKWLEDNEA